MPFSVLRREPEFGITVVPMSRQEFSRLQVLLDVIPD